MLGIILLLEYNFMPVTKKEYNEEKLLTYTLFDSNNNNTTISLKYLYNIYKLYF